VSSAVAEKALIPLWFVAKAYQNFTDGMAVRLSFFALWQRIESRLSRWADRVPGIAFGEGRHDAADGLQQTVLYHALDSRCVVDVPQGIAGYDNEVCQLAGFDCAEVFAKPKSFRRGQVRIVPGCADSAAMKCPVGRVASRFQRGPPPLL
jgi:hypothetical protein